MKIARPVLDRCLHVAAGFFRAAEGETRVGDDVGSLQTVYESGERGGQQGDRGEKHERAYKRPQVRGVGHCFMSEAGQ